MRKFLLMVLAAITLASGAAFAQDDMMTDSSSWAGVSTGFPFGLVLHYGLEDLIAEDIDLRGNLSAVTFFGSFFFVNVGADALYQLNLETVNDLPLDVYAGGGLNVGVGIGDGVSFTGSVRALGGAEYMFTDTIGAFGEVRIGVGVLQLFQPSLSVGVNYHF